MRNASASSRTRRSARSSPGVVPARCSDRAPSRDRSGRAARRGSAPDPFLFWRNAEAKLPEPWRADRDKQRCDGPSMLPQVVESRLDQVATRKIGRSGEYSWPRHRCGSEGVRVSEIGEAFPLRRRGPGLPNRKAWHHVRLHYAEVRVSRRGVRRLGDPASGSVDCPPEASAGRMAFVDLGHRQNKRPFSSTGLGSCIRVLRSP